MKKLYSIFLLAALSAAHFINAQSTIPTGAESAPVVLFSDHEAGDSRAAWDLLFNHNMAVISTSPNGYAGVALFNNEFWISKWASDTIFKFTASGSFIKAFVINGLSGVRAFTTDGLYIYASNNTNQIFRINPVLEQLAANQITINPGITSVPQARFCSYDSTLNAGAGGFWIGNFTTDLIAIDKSGNFLDSIPVSVHGLTGMYGVAIDNYSVGGPYIFAFDQGGANASRVVKISVATGLATDLHEAYPDLQAANSLSSALAGGAFVTDKLVPGKVVFVGMLQGTPDNVLFGYEAGDLSSAIYDENDNNVNLFPNPTTGKFTLSLSEVAPNSSYKLMDIAGQLISEGYATGKNTVVDMSALANGVYSLSVYNNGSSIARKMVIKN